MKKTIGLICALIAFLTSCTNDDAMWQSENNQSVTISAAVDLSFEGEKQALSSKSRAGSSYRYIMEVYSDENYTTMVGEQETSDDGNFTLTLDRTNEYYLLLWADANGASVYDTKNLKSVTLINGKEAVEAFSGKATIKGSNPTISVTLKRCVGELRLMETGTIPAGTIKVDFNEPTSFDVSTGIIGTATKKRSQNIVFAKDINRTTVDPVQLNTNSIYILSNAEPSDIDFTIQYTAGTEGAKAEDAINVTGSIKANSRTNINGHYTSVVPEANLKKTYTYSDYYQWDADDPINGVNNGYSKIASGLASSSCKNCPTVEHLKIYIGAGVYWDNGDSGTGQQTYNVKGNTYHAGLWMKKMEYIDSNVTPTTELVPTVGRPTDISKYFFLPAIGYTEIKDNNITIGNLNTFGNYWSKTGVDGDKAWRLIFCKTYVKVDAEAGRSYAFPLLSAE